MANPRADDAHVPSRARAGYAVAVAVSTWILLLAGGMVTSTGSGLAVPDWPLSFGQVFPEMRGGVLYEHGHRMIASVVGLLILVQAVWIHRAEPRRSVRGLGWAAAGCVVVQGLLGGATVLLRLPDAVSVSHAALAQIVFALTVAIAIGSSRAWHALGERAPAADPGRVSVLALASAAAGLVWLQIVLGALVRHAGAGLAIPTFPLAYGRLVPPLESLPVRLHFAHRAGAVVVAAAVVWAAVRALRLARATPSLALPARLALGLVAIQVGLGGWTVLSFKHPWVTTAHLGTGALLFAATVALALVAARGTVPAGGGVEPARAPRPERRDGPIGDWLALTKPRIVALVLVTTAVGTGLASSGPVDWVGLLSTLFGTALAAGGSAALNQFAERDLDALMRRTERRPVPAGRVSPNGALLLGLALSLGGTAWLAARANLLTGLLAAATIVLYVGVYTPLKRRTPLNTLVGAIPGALPPVMGWTAVTGSIGGGAVVLFAILFLWQLPHFLAIAWMHRDDYARAGFRMLPTGDPDGARTGRLAALYAGALVPVSLAPTALGLTGATYFAGALALGAAFLAFGVALARDRRSPRARRLLLASVTYLPLLLVLLVLDRAA